ncbi:aldehyde dehydrogenase family protein [Limnochorda pilosa]|uniref:3-sulfolactaldehyde dehydrogenase n=1 Tax=Limnochorda pilosa TaxID=1555112 RepID=A0A0K2SM64_LIMPI|nr:aldehyde dehydrogenase family protein [Limnochorda pilosa]BAS27924.1 aldehyde dehydrogenase [Limnochorda pilosa]
MDRYGIFVDGSWQETGEWEDVRNKFTGEVLARVSVASREDVARAVRAARLAADRGPLPAYQRYEILLRARDLLTERVEDFARTIAAESGKPLKEARVEVSRAVQTLTLSGEEAKRIHGEGVPVEAAPGAENRLAFTIRAPVGVVCAISPFNFPLNLAAHKIAPALAAGNAVVHKPAGTTPLTAAKLCQVLVDAGLPPGYLNLVFGPGARVGDWLLEDPEIDMYTFTGSPAIGERIKAKSGLRRVTLELGNNSAVIVHKDAELATAARLSAARAFANAGQVCISVQRIYVQKDILDAFSDELVRATQALKVGDPLDPGTDVGPMISEAEAARAEDWVHEAVEGGAKLLTGGTREGPLFQPTVLADVHASMKVVCNEVFAPVVTVIRYDTIDEAIEAVNDSHYGLQAGIFTESLEVAMEAARRIRVGGVMVNDTSSFRADLMPYGGVKGSGMGREGPKYAVEEMTDLKVIVLNLKGAR